MTNPSNRPTPPFARRTAGAAALAAFALLGLVGLASPSLAQDAALGEKEFGKCKSCHSITAPDGTAIVKGGKTGPNLYGVIGRHVATAEGFNYGPSIVSVGAGGLIWDEAEIAAYVTDPKAWLADKTGDAASKSKMTFKLAKNQADVAAYLASVVQ